MKRRAAMLLPTMIGLLGACQSASTAGPEPTEGFQTVFGTANFDEGRSIIQAPDGNLLIAGAGNGVIAPADGTNSTPSLTMIGPRGEVVWTRVYDDLRYGTAHAVVEIGSNRYAILASRADALHHDPSLAIWDVDGDGALRDKVYERLGSRVASWASRPLMVPREGGLVLAALDTPDDAPEVATVIRLDDSGSVLWTLEFEGLVEIASLVESSGGDILAIGTKTTTGPAYEVDVFASLLAADGTVRWTSTYGEPGEADVGVAAAAEVDGVVIAGSREDPTGTYRRIPFILRLDADGNAVWEVQYDVPGTGAAAFPRGLTVLRDGGIALVGRITAEGADDRALVLYAAANGVEQDRIEFGHVGDSFYATDVTELSGGRLVFTGAEGPNTPSFGGADFDVIVIALESR